jgi:hypothetical protein
VLSWRVEGLRGDGLREIDDDRLRRVAVSRRRHGAVYRIDVINRLAS